MKKEVVILDCLQLEYVRRRRGRGGQCLETYHDIGFAGEDAIDYDERTCKIYRSIHWAGEHWIRVEHVLVGDGAWKIPMPDHPDCLVVREPHEGEIFDSDRELLWLAPGRCVELTGGLATKVFEAKHGEVVGSPQEYLEQVVFEDCLNSLVAEYGHEIEGELGRHVVAELTRAVGAAKLVDADEDVIGQITDRVHDSVMKFMERIVEQG